MFSVTPNPIDISAILANAIAPENGALATFMGTVRNHSEGQKIKQLYYEAYAPMALKSFEAVEKEVRALWKISQLSIIHRTGALSIGEIAVFILATAPHRKEALSACSYTIDRVKEISPIWKKEIV